MSNFESHNDMSFRARSSRAYEAPKSQQFYYPRPELKPNYSTSSANRFTSNTNDLNYTMNNNYYQLGQHQQQQDYLSSANDNPFAPIGYSRQRSTSLLPTIGSHHRNHPSTSSNLVNNEIKSNPSFDAYPLYVPSSSRVGAASSNDYYIMNSRLYPSESSKYKKKKKKKRCSTGPLLYY